ncbi:MAG: hypothetical protein C4K48_07945 [Candidatus Thorarchaeota archaeon]|nr:MAG: hypothetical protein C4K48_07945 [Candidatus Thorarchaeota archaeon]
MKKQVIFATAILGLILTMNIGGEAATSAVEISPAIQSSTTVNWRIVRAPQYATNAVFSNGGYWQAEEDGVMSFAVTDMQEDIAGELRLGNMTVTTNDTMTAKDLTLGVWGIVEFWPGLFIKIGRNEVQELNDTAYASAEHVAGNYLNGTMLSYYDNLTLDDIEHECIVFEYQQDPTAAGTPQHTTLVYNISTGVLVYANTSYYLGESFKPYVFEIEFLSIDYTGTMPGLLIGLTIVMLVSVAAVALVMMEKRKMF